MLDVSAENRILISSTVKQLLKYIVKTFITAYFNVFECETVRIVTCAL